jgi:hypothetical protein
VRLRRLAGAWLALWAVWCAGCAHSVGDEPVMQLVHRFPVPTAHQAVAVVEGAFYAVDSRAIEKYDLSGKLRASFDAGPDARFIHLNGCSVHAGVLYCAHSNYPDLPMQSSIERFDAITLAHLGTRALDEAPGSATWVDRAGARWLVAFAQYAGKGGEPGRGPEASRLIDYDSDWRRVAEYRYPDALVARFGDYSNSGGAVMEDGRLLLTGRRVRCTSRVSTTRPGAARLDFGPVPPRSGSRSPGKDAPVGTRARAEVVEVAGVPRLRAPARSLPPPRVAPERDMRTGAAV